MLHELQLDQRRQLCQINMHMVVEGLRLAMPSHEFLDPTKQTRHHIRTKKYSDFLTQWSPVNTSMLYVNVWLR